VWRPVGACAAALGTHDGVRRAEHTRSSGARGGQWLAGQRQEQTSQEEAGAVRHALQAQARSTQAK